MFSYFFRTIPLSRLKFSNLHIWKLNTKNDAHGTTVQATYHRWVYIPHKYVLKHNNPLLVLLSNSCTHAHSSVSDSTAFHHRMKNVMSCPIFLEGGKKDHSTSPPPSPPNSLNCVVLYDRCTPILMYLMSDS